MFKVKEGRSVVLREDYPFLGLKAGDTGLVWAMYATDPAAYKVTFCRPDREPFDMTVTEEDIIAVESSTLQSARQALA